MIDAITVIKAALRKLGPPWNGSLEVMFQNGRVVRIYKKDNLDAATLLDETKDK